LEGWIEGSFPGCNRGGIPGPLPHASPSVKIWRGVFDERGIFESEAKKYAYSHNIGCKNSTGLEEGKLGMGHREAKKAILRIAIIWIFIG